MTFRLLISDDRGRVIEHPHLLATVRYGELLEKASGHPIALPEKAKLVQLPGRLPVGFDPATQELTLVREVEVAGKRSRSRRCATRSAWAPSAISLPTARPPRTNEWTTVPRRRSWPTSPAGTSRTRPGARWCRSARAARASRSPAGR